MKEGTVEIRVPGHPAVITLAPGDWLDLHAGGLLVFYPEPLATAQRTIRAELQKQTRETILFTEDRVRREVEVRVRAETLQSQADAAAS